MLLLSRRELLALALLFVVSLPAVTSRLYSSDEVQYFSYLRSLYFDRDVSFENEYRYFYDHHIAQSAGFHETFLERTTDDQPARELRDDGMRDPVAALLRGGRCRGGARQGSQNANGFSKPYIRAVAYGSAFYGFLAVLLSIRAVRYSFSVLGFGTRYSAFGLRYSGFGDSVFGTWVRRSTGCSGLGWRSGWGRRCSSTCMSRRRSRMRSRRLAWRCSSTSGCACGERWSVGGAFALGVCAALLAMIREQDVFIALGPASISSWWRQFPARGRGWSAARGGVAGLVASLGYLPQLLAYNALNGYPGPASHVARKMFWYAPHGLQVLFSPQHGFFFWTPLALLAIAGWSLLVGAGGGRHSSRRALRRSSWSRRRSMLPAASPRGLSRARSGNGASCA